MLDYTGDEVDIAFQFEVAKDIINSAKVGIGALFAAELSTVVDSFPPGQYATFITNHDQNRVMSAVDGDEGAARVAASLLLTSPGVPFLYYGEEIGMRGEKPDEDIRRPMQWSGEEASAGFTTGVPWRPPHEDYLERNVAAQAGDPDSLLNHYRALIALRNENEALRSGNWTLIENRPSKLYAALRASDSQVLLVLINPSDDVIDDYTLTLAAGPFSEPVNATLLLGKGAPAPPELNPTGGFDAYAPLESLPPHSTIVIQLEPS